MNLASAYQSRNIRRERIPKNYVLFRRAFHDGTTYPAVGDGQELWKLDMEHPGFGMPMINYYRMKGYKVIDCVVGQPDRIGNMREVQHLLGNDIENNGRQYAADKAAYKPTELNGAGESQGNRRKATNTDLEATAKKAREHGKSAKFKGDLG